MHAGGFLVRAGSGFLNPELFRAIRRHGRRFCVSATMQVHVRTAIEQVPEAEWVPIVRRDERGSRPQPPPDPNTPSRAASAGVRRVLNHDPADHAQLELVIRDLKEAGLAHVPSGTAYASTAWLVLATLAHNL